MRGPRYSMTNTVRQPICGPGGVKLNVNDMITLRVNIVGFIYSLTQIFDKDNATIPQSQFLHHHILPAILLHRHNRPIASLRQPQAIPRQTSLRRQTRIEGFSSAAGELDTDSRRELLDGTAWITSISELSRNSSMQLLTPRFYLKLDHFDGWCENST